jgi:hypothetical protein
MVADPIFIKKEWWLTPFSQKRMVADPIFIIFF